MAAPKHDAAPKASAQDPNEGQPFEPFTCATAHLSAERTLRLLEQCSGYGTGIDHHTIERLERLVDRAGAAFARRALERGDVPF